MDHNNFWAHFHLTVNDLPILGFLFATVFLILALTTRWRDSWARAGMVMLAFSFLGVLAAFFSGDPALHVISGQARTSARALSQHHKRGLAATIIAMITVIIATVAILKARKAGGVYSKRLLIIVLIATALSAAAMAWTGLAGGRINHPELQEPADRESGPAQPH
ncbi:hypothetical protein [Chitinophaga japonensis]|uniref:DUF2231 domain-containing protein n=1 Tax=Chitinophaga japonensis TaxID=104662 RepID=A0A562SN18_CHIJA|nr:hypothetical protein [Chitinophaga japonensis]TWI82608.1 hypothetical protein LX66_5183 [Chitinophaga japonensis]